MRSRRLACLCLLGACQGPNQVASSSFGTSITTAPPATSSTGTTDDPTSTSSSSSSTSTTSTGSSDDSTGSAASSTTWVLDVGTEQDVENPQPAGCKGKIDFLFVISSHEVMGPGQAKLVAAFPDFIDTIETKFADFDYHIMVVDTYWNNLWGALQCDEQCPALDAACEDFDYPCDYVPSTCDKTLGAGTIYNAGDDAANKPCDLVNGRRYIEKGQPDLMATFTCLAQVGTNGWNPLGDAVAAAVSPALTGPGDCNEGFLRDDALLMVTIIGPPDSPPLDSQGKPKEWAQAVIDAKHGDVDSVVMFRICDASCPTYDRACTLAKYYFPYHHIESLNVPEFGSAFNVATDLVETACSAFIPG